MSNTKIMTHEERRSRREAIAEAISKGQPVHKVVSQFGVTLESIRRACIEFGVERPKTPAA